jgi:hypothetical protein
MLGGLAPKEPKRVAGNEVTLEIEGVVDGRMSGEEALRRSSRLEALHLPFSSSHHLVAREMPSSKRLGGMKTCRAKWRNHFCGQVGLGTSFPVLGASDHCDVPLPVLTIKSRSARLIYLN